MSAVPVVSKSVRAKVWRWVGWLAGAAFVALLAPALWQALRGQDWSTVTVLAEQGDRGRLGLLLAGALLVTTVAPLLGMLSWRAIMVDLGASLSTPQAVRMFCVGFFSKYLPVKGLALVLAARMARTSGVTMGRFFGAGVLSMAVTTLTAFAVGLLAGVTLLGDRVGWLLLALVPIAVMVVWPQLINRAVGWAMRVLRRPPPQALLSARGMRRGVLWQCLAWLVSGLHLWLLALAVNAAPGRSLLLCLGAFSLATAIGVLVIVVPDGIGVREAVLMGALTTVLPVPQAAVVVVASRLVTTVSEVGLGAVAMVAAEIAYRKGKAGGNDHSSAQAVRL